ncbi:MAG: biotin transporter BioY [Candidatus Omnitrophota bacterium]
MEAILKREIILNKTICRLLGALAFVIFTSLGAFVRIPLPFTPVPLSLQTFFVLLSGAFLGRKLGAASQLGYVLLGIAGIPVFSGAGSGVFYLLGPTGGYLFGFILSAFLIGRLITRAKNNFISVFVILLLADAALFACGILWLKVLLGYPLGQLLSLGVIPFIPGDLLKISAASVLYVRFGRRIREIFY